MPSTRQPSTSIRAVFLCTTILLLSQISIASINLNSSATGWNYTIASGLAPGVSQECQAAYATPIDCDPTIFSLTEDFSNEIHAPPAKLRKLCRRSCKASLEDYTQQLGLSCTGKNDLAIQGSARPGLHFLHAYIVGQIFEYAFAQACSTDEDNKFCFTGQNPHITINCNDTCTSKFYRNTNNFAPASYKRFTGELLVSRTAYWISQFQNGYTAMQQCPPSNSSESNKDDGRQGGANHSVTGQQREQTASTSTLASAVQEATPMTTSIVSTPPPRSAAMARNKLRHYSIFLLSALVSLLAS